jgi:glycosyltransferase involved in cell wall biosynthesis
MGAPQVSVVVATRDRARRLDALLSSLCSQTLPADDFEVIVVDDGSRDATQEVLARHASAGGLQLSSVRHAESQGAAAARNAGWRRARAPLIAFTDDDCTPSIRAG